MTGLNLPPSKANDVSRRRFLTTLTGVGSALAVQPISTQTLITTSANGLAAGSIEIPVSDGVIPAYRAMPAGTDPFPVILVVQEIFGVHEHIQDICRRLATLGYLTIAPELYARQGDVSKLDSVDAIRPIVALVADAQVLSNLDRSVDWAAAHGGDIERLGITGFCWGGRITWLYAAHQPKLKAAVAWYGRLNAEKNNLTPQHPFDIARRLKAPVLGLYGGQNAVIPLAQVEQMREKLNSAGNPL